MLPDPNDRIVASDRRYGYLPRWVKLAVAGVSLAVFIAFVGYAYLGRSNGPDGEVPLIRADQQPMKMRPDDPGGMDVPHQDKEIYNRMARDGAEPPSPRVERLLPPPEAPLPRPSTAPAPEAATPPPVAAAPPVAAEAPAAPAPRTETAKPAPAPQPLTAAPTPAPPAQPSQAPTRQAAVPSPAQAQKPASAAGRFRVQIASMRTAEDAARAAERLQRSHPDLLGKLAVNVVRADLGNRGTFFRVQAGPLADEGDAKELCRKLSAQKVGCIIVRP